MKSKSAIVFFDGVCNLCNRFIRFIYRNDERNLFQYKSLQADQAKEQLNKYDYHYSDEKLQSFVLIYDDKLYTKSSAALKVFQLLGFPFSMMSIFYPVPKGIRDSVYSFIAKNRYKWFGKTKEVCEYDPEFQKRVK